MSIDSLGYALPELILLATALVVVVVGLVFEREGPVTAAAVERSRLIATVLAIFGSVLSLVALLALGGPTDHPVDPFSGTFVVDHYALFLKALLLLFAVVTILLGYRFSETFRPHQSEFIGLILLATVGGMFMASAREMIELFVALETLSISLYVMVSFHKGDRKSSEAGFKYLVVGAASSAILLYGLAILYGLTGRTNLDAVGQAIATRGTNSPALMLAALFIIGGFSFKIAAVPFHQWVPDVYQGAPTPVTAFIAVSSKTAGYALLIRVLTSALLPLAHQWSLYRALIAAVTMTLGNVSALTQTSVKRLLGYSSIAHAGYLILGLIAIGDPQSRVLGIGALLFYLLVYGLTNLAAFASLQAAESAAGSDEIAALGGLAQRSGGVALVMSLAFLSLTGIPPLIGFFGKLFLFLAAVQAGYAWLALVALANSALSAVYYLRVVRALYMEEGKSTRPLALDPALLTALAVGTIGIVPLAVFAGTFVDRAQAAAKAVFLR
jgi:proton-translocating NADH-quinone oxidoreductase chain N